MEDQEAIYSSEYDQCVFAATVANPHYQCALTLKNELQCLDRDSDSETEKEYYFWQLSDGEWQTKKQFDMIHALLSTCSRSRVIL